jgi:hypothetical protein
MVVEKEEDYLQVVRYPSIASVMPESGSNSETFGSPKGIVFTNRLIILLILSKS